MWLTDNRQNYNERFKVVSKISVEKSYTWILRTWVVEKSPNQTLGRSKVHWLDYNSNGQISLNSDMNHHPNQNSKTPKSRCCCCCLCETQITLKIPKSEFQTSPQIRAHCCSFLSMVDQDVNGGAGGNRRGVDDNKGGDCDYSAHGSTMMSEMARNVREEVTAKSGFVRRRWSDEMQGNQCRRGQVAGLTCWHFKKDKILTGLNNV